ncbi:16284_t:CDS:1, partial [Dentiscutata heterogama]
EVNQVTAVRRFQLVENSEVRLNIGEEPLRNKNEQDKSRVQVSPESKDQLKLFKSVALRKLTLENVDLLNFG